MRKLLAIALFSCFFNKSNAQFRFGIFGGISNYQGDLTDRAFMRSDRAIGLTAGYDLSGHLNLRAGFTIAKIEGADSLSYKQALKERNLSFQSNISEIHLVAEYNFLNLYDKKWSPYLFGGVAVFHFNPYTYDINYERVYLRPLKTEGQGVPGYPDSKPYALTQPAIPFGGGFKFNLGEKVRFAIEAGLRKTFTDYLDDVSKNYADRFDLIEYVGQESVNISYRGDELPNGSPFYPQKGAQRGSSKYKDYYYFTGVHLTFLIGKNNSRSYYRSQSKKGYGCPTVPL